MLKAIGFRTYSFNIFNLWENSYIIHESYNVIRGKCIYMKNL